MLDSMLCFGGICLIAMSSLLLLVEDSLHNLVCNLFTNVRHRIFKCQFIPLSLLNDGNDEFGKLTSYPCDICPLLSEKHVVTVLECMSVLLLAVFIAHVVPFWWTMFVFLVK